MKLKMGRILFLLLIMTLVFSKNIYANSSWVWLTTSPLTILPIAIIVTLFIEILGISKLNDIKRTKTIIFVVIIANIVSFIVPYIERANRFIPTTGGFSFTAAFNKGPYYIILIGYLLLTLIIEIPIVYLSLQKYVDEKLRLIITVITVNIITTAIVAILERIICVGQW